jgi:hypothetical protein
MSGSVRWGFMLLNVEHSMFTLTAVQMAEIILSSRMSASAALAC